MSPSIEQKPTAFNIWQILLRQAAADHGMTLEEVKQGMLEGRVLLSIRFIVTPKEGKSEGHEPPNQAL